jgi:hypothetical protein
MLLWDAKQQLVFRVHIEGGSDARWERWTGAARERVLADDSSDGFDLASYVEGLGRVGMSTNATAFVRKHASGRFDRAL